MLKDALYWAEKIKNKEVSARELMEETIKRVEQLNPTYNAIVEFKPELALAQLEATTFTSGQPFAGVPIPLKMLGQEKAGLGSTAGAKLFKDQKSTITDNFVQKIESLGFIPLGKTNAPEFGFKNISDPELYGVTKNTWNPNYHAGGSSGGAAAAVSSGMFPLAGASDGGGSIRIPASFSGLIGLKPTRGTMPTGPGGWRDWQGASTSFALTISMRDTETLFQHLRGVSKIAPYQGNFYAESHVIPQKLKIAYCLASPVGNPVSKEAEAALKAGIKFLEKQGHELVEIDYPVDGLALIQSYYKMNGAETAAMAAGIEAALGRKLNKTDVEPMTWAIYQYGLHLKAASYSASLNLWDQAAATMETLFSDYDLFLSPSATREAPALEEELVSPAIQKRLAMAEELTEAELAELVFEMFERSLAITPYTQLANLTGQPSLGLPTYVTPSGLPIGLQLMASKGREDLLFKLGYEFEEEGQFILPTYYR